MTANDFNENNLIIGWTRIGKYKLCVVTLNMCKD